MTGYIVAFLLLLALSALFSASESAFSECNRLRIESAAESGKRSAATALKLLDRFDSTIDAILLGNSLANILAVSIACVACVETYGSTRWMWLYAVGALVLIVLFGEALPRLIAGKNANSLTLSLAKPVRVLTIIVTPFSWTLGRLAKLLTLPMRGEEQPEGDEAAVEELQSIIDTAEDESVLTEGRSELLKSALEFSELSASEAMTARVDVDAIDIDDDWDDIIAEIEGSTHSRLPVYEDSIDNIIGFLYLNHFLKALTDDPHPDIRAMLMEPLYVYKTIKLPQVLAELRHAKKHLAIVTDEYGGTLGVISLEDVLEQIVGEIWDETDEVETEVVEKAEGEYELDGDMTISDFLELVGLDEDDFECESDTVGGWAIEMFGRFPEPGESFDYDGLTVTILAMDKQRVDKVLVHRHETEQQDE
ncbi:MAG TPA: HlyC/CorC family transporter [Candidatus Scatomorpha gallistercoris]|nr:HlyC/CorC family transporter [Candidatus Scatomorpha gallistercoris]